FEIRMGASGIGLPSESRTPPRIRPSSNLRSRLWGLSAPISKGRPRWIILPRFSGDGSNMFNMYLPAEGSTTEYRPWSFTAMRLESLGGISPEYLEKRIFAQGIG